MGIRDHKNAVDEVSEPPRVRKRISRTSKAKDAATTRVGGKVLEALEQLQRDGGNGTLVTGPRRTLAVTNLNKIYFPRARLTKGHVMRYYAALAPIVLPLIKDRPLVLKRFPNGIRREGGAFFQQAPPEQTPAGVRVEKVRTADGMEPRIVGGDLTTLLYGVQIGAIELNPWHSRTTSPRNADYAILDLDPGPQAAFALVMETAGWIWEVMTGLDLRGAVKTSGGRGMHVYIPLPARTSFTTARAVADLIAHHVHGAHPRDTTLIRALKQRPPNAVYIDVGQNDYGKSVAAAFSLRAREPGPVSTPLEWSELREEIEPADFTIDTVLPDAERRAGIWREALRRPIDPARLTRSTRHSSSRTTTRRRGSTRRARRHA